MIDLSVIVPVFNEEECISESIMQILRFFDVNNLNAELIIMDDASTDSSIDIVKEIKINDERIRLFSMSKNTGKFGALIVGMREAQGSIIVTLDGDMQNNPNEISLLIKELDNGADAVIGWRKNRKDSFIKRMLSIIMNTLANVLFLSNFHDMNSGFRVMNLDAKKDAEIYIKTQRFLPHFLKYKGHKVVEVSVSHKKRKIGNSKFGLINRVHTIIDLILVRLNLIKPYIPGSYK